MRMREELKLPLRGALLLGSALVLLAQVGCLISPVRTGPTVTGLVVDAATGKPLEGAVVVVRYDGRYNNLLPDRQVLAHLETTTDSSGRFEVGPLVKLGVAIWPMYQTEVRMASALRDGYRCARPRTVRPGRALRVTLEPALDEEDRRDSCRPVPADAGEAVAYMESWRALHASGPSREELERDHQIDRMLEARAVFGFGENCQGPVLDLSLAPGGHRMAFLAAGAEGSEIKIVEFGGPEPGRPQKVGLEERSPPRNLAWTGPGDLVMWGRASALVRSASVAVIAGDSLERVWQASAVPAAPAGDAQRSSTRRSEPGVVPLSPADLSDEGDSLWMGRSFSLLRALDPETGLSADRLQIVREDGSSYHISLPGEACGTRGRFGRPHYRIASDGRTAVDLRFVQGGCHAVALDLESGSWSTLDGLKSAAVCNETRAVPASLLRVGLRSYLRELQAAVSKAGADTAAAYSLEIRADGTTATTRDFAGAVMRVDAPAFPLVTPLRRIEVSLLSAGTPPTPPRAEPEPVYEPL